MIAALIMIVAAIAALGVLWLVLRGQSLPVRTLEDLDGQTIAVDLNCFRNLIDEEEETYLRAHLPSREFRKIQKARLLAAMQYLDWTAHNAALLLRLGEAARVNPDPAIAAAGRELANAALKTRLYCFLALCRLCVAFAVPKIAFTLSDTIRQCEHLRRSLSSRG